MKILFVDIQYDYGQQGRGLNTVGQFGFKKALEDLGHQVIPFYYDDLQGQKQQLALQLESVANTQQPDLIFFTLFGDQFDQDLLDRLRARWRTINWFGDDTWRFDSFSSRYAPHFTYCVTTDKFSLKKYLELGVNNVFLSQWASAFEEPPQAKVSSCVHDVTFVGTKNPYRVWFLKQLRKAGIQVQAFGHGWPNGSISQGDMFKLYRASRINLNLSNSISYDIRYLCSGWRPIYDALRAKKYADQIKARNFEIAASGGFQLAQYVPGLEDYFVIGREIICYSRQEEAIDLIRYYLSNETERLMIARDGQERALREHGYKHRLQIVLDQISDTGEGSKKFNESFVCR